MELSRTARRAMVFPLVAAAAFLLGAGSAVLGVCGPFTDVSDPGFCPFVLEIFTLGITTGTTPTTYDPGTSVTRLQMAAFLSRTVDGVLERGSRRAALRQFWDVQNAQNLLLTVTLGGVRRVQHLGPEPGTRSGRHLGGRRSRFNRGGPRDADRKRVELPISGGVRRTAHPRDQPISRRRLSLWKAADLTPLVATLTGNGLDSPVQAAFDGQRVLVTNVSGNSVSLWKAADLSPISSVPTGPGTSPIGACSDGINFWIVLDGNSQLARF